VPGGDGLRSLAEEAGHFFVNATASHPIAPPSVVQAVDDEIGIGNTVP